MDHNDETCLHCAAKYNHFYNILNISKSFPHKVDLFNKDSETALHIAIRLGNNDSALLLIAVGAGVNIPGPNQSTAFHYAAECGNFEIFNKLLHIPTIITGVKDAQGRTALHLATKERYPNIATSILSHARELLEILNNNGEFALHLTESNKKPAVGHELVRCCQKAAQKIAPIDSSSFIDICNKYGVNSKDSDHRTMLHIAVIHGLYQMVDYLLSIGADISIQDRYCKTALHYAAECGATNMVRTLVQTNNDINHIECIDKGYKRPLHYAAISGNLDCINVLLSAGAQIDARDIELRTPLHCATSWGKLRTMEALLNAGAGLELRDINGQTALHRACGNGSALWMLIQANAIVSPVDNNYQTPLKLAYIRRKNSAIQILIYFSNQH